MRIKCRARVWNEWLVAFAFSIAIQCHSAPQLTSGQAIHYERCVSRNYFLHLGSTRLYFDPAEEKDLRVLQAQVTAALTQKNPPGCSSEPPTKGYWRGLKEIKRLTGILLDSPSQQTKTTCLASLLEVVAAANNSRRSPLPNSITDIEIPEMLMKRLCVPVGTGSTPATNLELPSAAENPLPGKTYPDLSCLDPAPSSFWHRPENISATDLYHGFGRCRCFELNDRVCVYVAPKHSHGLNPGFVVSCDGQKVKLKFAELSSEPFATRIFWALGYHADVTDFAAQVKVRYDRRLLQEFNSRKELKTRFRTLFFISVYTLKLQRRYSPFDYISTAVLHDGRAWSGAELRTRLFHDPLRPHPEEDPANFRAEIEAQIDYLVTVPANLQPASERVKTIGSWDFGQLDHSGRRELRGVCILAAWLGWFDTRFDNTRLRVVRQGKQRRLVHFFSDLGGVLGQTSGFLFSRGEQPNAFPWAFTRPALRQGPHRMTRLVRLRGYKPIAAPPAFKAMTIDDARWMARLIGQLTEQQIIQALVASGFDSAEARLYTEKLLSRRDRMIIDLGLATEIPLLRPGGSNRGFSYYPAMDGPVTVTVAGEGVIQAPTSHFQVQHGRLVLAR